MKNTAAIASALNVARQTRADGGEIDDSWPHGVAKNVSNKLKRAGFETTLNHSSTTEGNSAYLGVTDPTTGRYIPAGIRLSDHSTGPNRMRAENQISRPEDSHLAEKWAHELRALGPTSFWKDKKLLEDAGKGHLTGKHREKAIAALKGRAAGGGAGQGTSGNPSQPKQPRQPSQYPAPTQASGPGVKMHTGPIKSSVAGRTDHLPMHVPSGSYVIPADIISAMGEGNTAAGFRHMAHIFGGQTFGGAPYKGPDAAIEGGMPYRAAGGEVPPVPIVAAGGEYVLSPDQVRGAGAGDLEKGHRVLDSWVLKMRDKTIKTLKGLPGPRRN